MAIGAKYHSNSAYPPKFLVQFEAKYLPQIAPEAAPPQSYFTAYFTELAADADDISEVVRTEVASLISKAASKSKLPLIVKNDDECRKLNDQNIKVVPPEKSTVKEGVMYTSLCFVRNGTEHTFDVPFSHGFTNEQHEVESKPIPSAAKAGAELEDSVRWQRVHFGKAFHSSTKTNRIDKSRVCGNTTADYPHGKFLCTVKFKLQSRRDAKLSVKAKVGTGVMAAAGLAAGVAVAAGLGFRVAAAAGSVAGVAVAAGWGVGVAVAAGLVAGVVLGVGVAVAAGLGAGVAAAAGLEAGGAVAAGLGVGVSLAAELVIFVVAKAGLRAGLVAGVVYVAVGLRAGVVAAAGLEAGGTVAAELGIGVATAAGLVAFIVARARLVAGVTAGVGVTVAVGLAAGLKAGGTAAAGLGTTFIIVTGLGGGVTAGFVGCVAAVGYVLSRYYSVDALTIALVVAGGTMIGAVAESMMPGLANNIIYFLVAVAVDMMVAAVAGAGAFFTARLADVSATAGVVIVAVAGSIVQREENLIGALIGGLVALTFGRRVTGVTTARLAGAGAAGGVLIGAVVGRVVPGIGNLIGAVVGGLVGVAAFVAGAAGSDGVHAISLRAEAIFKEGEGFTVDETGGYVTCNIYHTFIVDFNITDT